ncbi:DNA segregation ATPase FtsK/SpoIIIE, S-DNA-T family [Arthrobacter sp. yr096]|uniref:FtsK/SpoIIIE domain-containing protein n=1 Tax=Arthrobacter sp. yr096 TaxID=1761750 RepID=UPI0008CAA68C|nr:FtsK/SpoIIIE domain-containing protein [Arthrobacter sp. yr096]SEI52838.1 DNA segregation ATPase FtsK/SpoIIIE, S-DNA-T family [Arthrobacter sp. yr096]
MTLECTLVRGPGAAGWSAPEELTIAVANGVSGLHLQSLLQEHRGTGNLSVDGRDLSTLTVGLPPLVTGAVIVEGQVPRADREPSSLPLMLLTHSGPRAGSVFQLQRGRFIIGRGLVDIQVADPGMSREHAVLEVSSTTLTLHEVKASSPVVVDGQPKRRESLTSGQTVQCGNSTFSVLAECGPFPMISNDAGRSVANPIEVPFARSTGNRISLALTAVLPLIAGVGLAVATGMWMYLGFTVISAVTLLVPLITGHRSRRECRRAVARAVLEDTDRRRHSSPSAAEMVMAAHRRSDGTRQAVPNAIQGMTRLPLAAGPQAGGGDEPLGAWVRLGITAAVANIRLVPDDPQFRPPPIGAAAMTLDPGHPVVGLRGHPAHVDALLRFIVVQLSSYPCAAELPVIIVGPVERLPLSARFMPGVTLVTHQGAALTALHRQKDFRSGRLIFIADPARDRTDLPEPLLDAASSAGWQVIYCSSSPDHAWPTIDLSPSGTSGHVVFGGERQHFVPDLVPDSVFDGYCRNVAAMSGLEDSARDDGVPDWCSLNELLPSGQRRILRRWDEPTLHNGLRAVLGQGQDGWVTFDFKSDGPHLLVAGTTGSGKSELLRTLIASMALSYSPEHTTFFFLDFKGGSGLRPLAGLPHCVGFLTDLGAQHLDRALASLRSEIRYREELFAKAGASDLAHYRRSPAGQSTVLPHLVVVIDEFRMLIDDAPGALRELMRVATIGRSLGIHLVMATQRPQGALTADIRANVTSSIALRVQSDSESMDIINSKAAASIPVAAPGRAFLAKASSKPQEFQAATLAFDPDLQIPDGPLRENQSQRVQATAQALQQNHAVKPVNRHQDALSDACALQLVSAVQDAWQFLSRPLPRQPVAAPLPTSIPWQTPMPSTLTSPTLQNSVTAPWAVGPVALADVPSQQRVDPLFWFPAEHGHLAMIGSAASGLHDCFRATSAMFAAQGPQPHVYVLDGAGFMGEPAGQGRIGAIAGLHQVQLASRVLRRLAEEMEIRRSARGADRTNKPLGLIITGWCSWAASFRAGPFAWAEAVLQDIVRDGGPLGIIVLISGERELVSSRFFAAIQNRAFFPCGSTEESRFHWPRLPEVEAIPGRSVLTGSWVDGQPMVAQFRQAPYEGSWPYLDLTSSPPPFRVLPLPDHLSTREFQDRLLEARTDRRLPEPALSRLDRGLVDQDADPVLWIGLGGDEGTPVSLPLRAGGVSTILGGRGTGKSSALGSLQTLNPLIPWITPGDRTSHDEFWASAQHEVVAGNLDPKSVLLVDDADSLDIQGRQALAALYGKVHGIVLTATPGPGLLHHLPLAREVQSIRMGLVLAPGSPHDGEMLGVRLDVDSTVRPGRGFIVNGTDMRPFQGAFSKDFPPRGLSRY